MTNPKSRPLYCVGDLLYVGVLECDSSSASSIWVPYAREPALCVGYEWIHSHAVLVPENLGWFYDLLVNGTIVNVHESRLRSKVELDHESNIPRSKTR